jgi:hypothetical protein
MGYILMLVTFNMEQNEEAVCHILTLIFNIASGECGRNGTSFLHASLLFELTMLYCVYLRYTTRCYEIHRDSKMVSKANKRIHYPHSSPILCVCVWQDHLQSQ